MKLADWGRAQHRHTLKRRGSFLIIKQVSDVLAVIQQRLAHVYMDEVIILPAFNIPFSVL